MRKLFIFLCLLLSACSSAFMDRSAKEMTNSKFMLGVDASLPNPRGTVSDGLQEQEYDGTGRTASLQYFPIYTLGLGASYSDATFDANLNKQNFEIESKEYSIFGTVRLPVHILGLLGLMVIAEGLGIPSGAETIMRPLFMIDPYLSAGGTFIDNTASFNGSNNTDSHFISFYEIGIRTWPIYHITLHAGRRFMKERTYNMGGLEYTVGGDSWVLGVNVVF